MFTHPPTYLNPKQNPCLDLHAKNDEDKQTLKMQIWVFFSNFVIIKNLMNFSKQSTNLIEFALGNTIVTKTTKFFQIFC
jgi:hypothetical protein